MTSRIVRACTFVACGLGTHIAIGQGIATERLIDSVVVTADREHELLSVPNTVATKTQEDLKAQNVFNPEDSLRYMPNLTIRKRYIGDRNALIGGRSFSTLQAARGLVLLDGYLLSNFLGRFDAPRWNMVSAEEIERVDAIYGPFSALYPGNSIGTTIAIRTRKPAGFEASLRTSAFMERFEEYGVDDTFDGYQVSAFLGDTFSNGGWFSLSANHQQATSHPMQYYTVSANALGQFPQSSGDATPVTGVRFDTDPRGFRRAVFGANAGAIDTTEQMQAKLRGGYALTDALEIDAFIALWRNETQNTNRTFLRDELDRPVWSGLVSADGIVFDVPSSIWAPGKRIEEHSLWGATLRTTRPDGWNGSLVYSQYDIGKDSLQEAEVPDSLAQLGGEGTNTERDGTGWRTFEAQSVYSPTPDDWTGGAHTLSFGFHRNDYQLRNPVFSTPDWRERRGELTQHVFGETALTALYVQDEWQISREWSTTVGVRYEEWRAENGGQRAGDVAIAYPSRSDTASSPKISIAYAPSDDWTVRLSAGRGVRFPTVAELFQGTVRASSIIVNDPNLKAEVSDALELSAQWQAEWGRLRVSVFEDDVRDSIFTQTNITVTPNRTNVQNVDRVRTRGIESAFSIDELFVDGLSVEGNVTFANAEILENDAFAVSVGNDWPRVARWRSNLQLAWRPNPTWLASLAWRYSDPMYNRLENDDYNDGVYGGVSGFSILDARVGLTLGSALELAIGIDNLTNERAYQSHPLSLRTAFLEARWSIAGEQR